MKHFWSYGLQNTFTIKVCYDTLLRVLLKIQGLFLLFV